MSGRRPAALTRRDLDALRALVHKEIERVLAEKQPATKRAPIPCGTFSRGNYPRCIGSAARGSGACTCGEAMARLARDAALWITWTAARGAIAAGQLDDAEAERMQTIADDIGEACGWRSDP